MQNTQTIWSEEDPEHPLDDVEWITPTIPKEASMKIVRSITCAVLVASVAGCGGTMQGIIRGEGTPVQFQFEQGLYRDFYTATIYGENFSGQAVDAGATNSFGNVYTTGGIGSVVTSTSSGNFVAVMFGDRGSSMRCQMNYADSTGFTSLGGVGICRMSNGRIIDVTW